MTRLSTANEGLAGSVFYTYTATPAAGQGTALQAALALNLLLMNMSALRTIGVGVNERNYAVLSHKPALPITAGGGAGTFGMLETVTATGGGTGKFLKESGGIVYLVDFSGTFTGTLTGAPSGATRTISSVGAPFGSLQEYLIYCPNGSSSTTATGIHSSYQGGDPYSVSETLPLGFSVAPEGGFNAALFTSLLDPASQAFWDDITITQAKLAPTLFHRIRQWKAGAVSQTIYWIQDNEPGSGFLCWHGKSTAGSDFTNCFIAADNLLDQGTESTGADKVYPNGFVWIDSGSAARPKTINNFRAVAWRFTARTMLVVTTSFASESILKSIPAGAFPPFGESTVATARVPFWTATAIHAQYNLNHFRFIPTNAAIANKFGDTNFKFIEVCKDYALPWDDFKANPGSW